MGKLEYPNEKMFCTMVNMVEVEFLDMKEIALR